MFFWNYRSLDRTIKVQHKQHFNIVQVVSFAGRKFLTGHKYGPQVSCLPTVNNVKTGHILLVRRHKQHALVKKPH